MPKFISQTSFEEVERLTNQIKTLKNVMSDINSNGIISPYLEEELIELGCSNIVEAVNSHATNHALKLLASKFNELTVQLNIAIHPPDAERIIKQINHNDPGRIKD